VQKGGTMMGSSAKMARVTTLQKGGAMMGNSAKMARVATLQKGGAMMGNGAKMARVVTLQKGGAMMGNSAKMARVATMQQGMPVMTVSGSTVSTTATAASSGLSATAVVVNSESKQHIRPASPAVAKSSLFSPKNNSGADNFQSLQDIVDRLSSLMKDIASKPKESIGAEGSSKGMVLGK
jgi:hypothetical protein